MKTLKIATRESQLALWQANWVATLLQQHHPDLNVELVKMTTEGDRRLDQSLVDIGGKGLFLKELEVALLKGEADIAVHSLKDVPVTLDDAFELCATLPRATPWDAFVSPHVASLHDLPVGATLGTSSLRRQAQAKALRPDLNVKLIRGNVGTRLDKLAQGEYDAILLAACGLERLNLQQHIRSVLTAEESLPAIGQGVVVVQMRKGDDVTRALLAPLHDVETHAAITAERTMGQLLGSSCQVPIAGYAVVKDNQLTLKGLVGEMDGSRLLKASAKGALDNPTALGEQVAHDLIQQGALDIVKACTTR